MAGLLLAVVVFSLIPQGAIFIIDSDRKIYDWIIRTKGGPPEREDFVLLGIDEASKSLSNLTEEEIEASDTLKLMGARWPWDRRVWAAAVDRLCESGAKLVVLDLIFAEPGTPEADDALAAAIARHPEKVVLASAFSPVGQQEDGHEVFMLVEPYVQFLESDPEPRIGFVNLWPDQRDNTTRKFRYRSSLGRENGQELEGEMEFLSLAGQIMDAYGAEIPKKDAEISYSSQIIFMDDGKELRTGNEVYKPRSVHEIFADSFWEKNYDNGEFFRDKVVMIGPVAARFQDIHATPVGALTGPQVHLQAAACGLAGAYVTHWGTPLTIMLLIGLASSVIAGWVERPRNSTIAFTILLVGTTTAVWLLGFYRSVMIPLTGAITAATVGWVMALTYQLVRERVEKGRIRGSFRRFVSRDVVDRLVDQPEAWAEIAAGRKRPVVVLFSDVRGFTSRSETAEPTELVEQLNEYFSAMVAIVFRHEGTLDKFIGDAVMAHWGAIDDDSDGDHARRALAAAQEMMEELAVLNQAWEKKGWAPFQMGIGVHLGEAVSGEIGSADRIEFSVIGDAVNLASRLEGLTKAFHCEIVFSDTVHEAAQPEGAKSLGKVRVKGRSGAVELYGYGDEVKIEDALSSMERDAEGAIVMTSK